MGYRSCIFVMCERDFQGVYDQHISVLSHNYTYKINLEFGRALGLILPLTTDSIFSFVYRTIQSKIICVLRDSNSRAFKLCHHAALLTTEPFCYDTDSLWHKYIAWFLKRQRTCQMKTRNKFCCICMLLWSFPSLHPCLCACGLAHASSESH